MTRAWRLFWLLLRKDLRIEARSREIVVTCIFFAVLVTILASLAFYLDDRSAIQVAPGVLWITLTFVGLLAMSRAWARERQDEALRGLLASPAPAVAIYLAKVASVLFFLLLVEAISVPLTALFLHVDLSRCHAAPLVLLALGTFGYAAMGTLFAALGVYAPDRDLTLSIVVFPLVTPVLLAGVVASREVFAGVCDQELLSWVRILLAFDLLSLAAGVLLFGRLMQER